MLLWSQGQESPVCREKSGRERHVALKRGKKSLTCPQGGKKEGSPQYRSRQTCSVGSGRKRLGEKRGKVGLVWGARDTRSGTHMFRPTEGKPDGFKRVDDKKIP